VIRHQMRRMCDAIIAATVAATVAAMIAPCNHRVWRFCKAVTLHVQHLKRTTYAFADALQLLHKSYNEYELAMDEEYNTKQSSLREFPDNVCCYFKTTIPDSASDTRLFVYYTVLFVRLRLQRFVTFLFLSHVNEFSYPLTYLLKTYSYFLLFWWIISYFASNLSHSLIECICSLKFETRTLKPSNLKGKLFLMFCQKINRICCFNGPILHLLTINRNNYRVTKTLHSKARSDH